MVSRERALEFKAEHPEITVKNYADLAEEIEDTDILIVSTGADVHTISPVHLKSGKEILILFFQTAINAVIIKK